VLPSFPVTVLPYEGVRPEWWTPAWEKLNGLLTNGSTSVMPVSPKDFKDSVDTDVYMVDQIGH
jgi:hypothetical protein